MPARNRAPAKSTGQEIMVEEFKDLAPGIYIKHYGAATFARCTPDNTPSSEALAAWRRTGNLPSPTIKDAKAVTAARVLDAHDYVDVLSGPRKLSEHAYELLYKALGVLPESPSWAVDADMAAVMDLWVNGFLNVLRASRGDEEDEEKPLALTARISAIKMVEPKNDHPVLGVRFMTKDHATEPGVTVFDGAYLTLNGEDFRYIPGLSDLPLFAVDKRTFTTVPVSPLELLTDRELAIDLEIDLDSDGEQATVAHLTDATFTFREDAEPDTSWSSVTTVPWDAVVQRKEGTWK